MKKAAVYVHGKGGNAAESEQYENIFENYDIIGFDYKAENPWQAKNEFPKFFDAVFEKYDSVILIANSIGAYFSMMSLEKFDFENVLLISPIVNMEKLIGDMMLWANVIEKELFEKKEIETAFGETLCWDYLSYARKNPVKWNKPTHILYGENDNLTSFETMEAFAKSINATLTVMKNGEHWFHTEEQMDFVYDWIMKITKGILKF